MLYNIWQVGKGGKFIFHPKTPTTIMRIQKVSYVVKVGETSHVMTMTRIVGLKIRELVLVKTKQAKK